MKNPVYVNPSGGPKLRLGNPTESLIIAGAGLGALMGGI